MKILGIDPGYAILGYGIIEKTGNHFRAIEYGAVTTDKDMPMPQRLEHLYVSLREIITTYSPDVASIEQLYFNNNAKTAINVGQARGVAILACVRGGIEVAEYTPLQIKQALVGYGRAAGPVHGEDHAESGVSPQTGRYSGRVGGGHLPRSFSGQQGQTGETAHGKNLGSRRERNSSHDWFFERHPGRKG